ncbi:hypothetical protein Salat_2290000 [Sesamum alatum]|uniref:Uncharacterized protein n=1 Tax=Sesamum alatum TaxID=300844 RepID=A0AAE2CE48_9LAMI|nr:hypothetical protein Salat_2290000 [Sesamum alatum]
MKFSHSSMSPAITLFTGLISFLSSSRQSIVASQVECRTLTGNCEDIQGPIYGCKAFPFEALRPVPLQYSQVSTGSLQFFYSFSSPLPLNIPGAEELRFSHINSLTRDGAESMQDVFDYSGLLQLRDEIRQPAIGQGLWVRFSGLRSRLHFRRNRIPDWTLAARESNPGKEIATTLTSFHTRSTGKFGRSRLHDFHPLPDFQYRQLKQEV